ncbi:MAG TPA: plastocyanin/azurin family copper-binding protein [Actinomycetota bacterium]|jgi:plastocyanin
MNPKGKARPGARVVVRVAVVLTLGASAACSASGASKVREESPVPVEAGITVEGLAFDPERTTVDVGTTLTWTNDDSVAHTVTSGTQGKEGVPGVSKGTRDDADGVFDGALDDAGATYSFTFDKAGTYEYFCRIHGGMTGVVVVK